MKQVTPDPKPRKRLVDKGFIAYLKTLPCIYQIDDKCREANQPHHDRTGYGDGKGCAARRPDDYRALRTCDACHDSLHASIGPRYREMVAKIGREDILRDQINNLFVWGKMQGWEVEVYRNGKIRGVTAGIVMFYQIDTAEMLERILDSLIDWIAKERGIG